MVAMTAVTLVTHPLIPETYILMLIVPLAFIISSFLLKKIIEVTYSQLKSETSVMLFRLALWAFRIWMLFVHAVFLAVIMFNFDQSFQLFGFMLCFALFNVCFGGLSFAMEKNPLLGMNLPWQNDDNVEWLAINKLSSQTMIASAVILFLMLPFVSFLEARYFELTIAWVCILIVSPMITASIYFIYLRLKEHGHAKGVH